MNAVVQIDTHAQLTLRRATIEDARMIFTWRNLPEIIALGTTQKPVEWEEHHAWFKQTLESQRREIFIVEIDSVPGGMVRYDLTPAEAEISIYLLPPFWGKGYGSKAFFATAYDVCVRRGIQRIVARVLRDNVGSKRFFRRLGFQPTESLSHGNLESFQLDCSALPVSRSYSGEQRVLPAETGIRCLSILFL